MSAPGLHPPTPTPPFSLLLSPPSPTLELVLAAGSAREWERVCTIAMCGVTTGDGDGCETRRPRAVVCERATRREPHVQQRGANALRGVPAILFRRDQLEPFGTCVALPRLARTERGGTRALLYYHTPN